MADRCTRQTLPKNGTIEFKAISAQMENFFLPDKKGNYSNFSSSETKMVLIGTTTDNTKMVMILNDMDIYFEVAVPRFIDSKDFRQFLITAIRKRGGYAYDKIDNGKVRVSIHKGAKNNGFREVCDFIRFSSNNTGWVNNIYNTLYRTYPCPGNKSYELKRMQFCSKHLSIFAKLLAGKKIGNFNLDMAQYDEDHDTEGKYFVYSLDNEKFSLRINDILEEDVIRKACLRAGAVEEDLSSFQTLMDKIQTDKEFAKLIEDDELTLIIPPPKDELLPLAQRYWAGSPKLLEEFKHKIHRLTFCHEKFTCYHNLVLCKFQLKIGSWMRAKQVDFHDASSEVSSMFNITNIYETSIFQVMNVPEDEILSEPRFKENLLGVYWDIETSTGIASEFTSLSAESYIEMVSLVFIYEGADYFGGESMLDDVKPCDDCGSNGDDCKTCEGDLVEDICGKKPYTINDKYSFPKPKGYLDVYCIAVDDRKLTKEQSSLPNRKILRVKSQDALLMAFFTILAKYRPEFACGFNDASFDWTWIMYKALNSPRRDRLVMRLESISTINFSYFRQWKLDGAYRGAWKKYYNSLQIYKPAQKRALYKLKHEYRILYDDVSKCFQNVKGVYEPAMLENNVKGNIDNVRYLTLPGMLTCDMMIQYRSTEQSESYKMDHILTSLKLGNKIDMGYDIMKILFRIKRKQELSTAQHKKWGTVVRQLGDGDVDVAYDRVMNLLIEYCIVDSIRVFEIAKKKRFLIDKFEVASLTHVPANEVFYRTGGHRARYFLVGKCEMRGIRFSLTSRGGAGGFTGGFVVFPKRGWMRLRYPPSPLTPQRRKWLENGFTTKIWREKDLVKELKVVFDTDVEFFNWLDSEFNLPAACNDFKSLYPSIIIEMNLSYETRIRKQWQLDECKKLGLITSKLTQQMTYDPMAEEQKTESSSGSNSVDIEEINIDQLLADSGETMLSSMRNRKDGEQKGGDDNTPVEKVLHDSEEHLDDLYCALHKFRKAEDFPDKDVINHCTVDYYNEIKESINIDIDEKYIHDGTIGLYEDIGEFGILPSIMRYLGNLRDSIKALMKKELNRCKKAGLTGKSFLYRYYNAKQLVVKVFMNSFYGLLGTPTSLTYAPLLATNITRRGRQLLLSIMDYSKEIGYKVYYGDTDSVFSAPWIDSYQEELMNYFTGKIDRRTCYRQIIWKCICLSKKFTKVMNRIIYDNFHGVEAQVLEFEKVIFPAIYCTKKKYVGLVNGDKIKTIEGVSLDLDEKSMRNGMVKEYVDGDVLDEKGRPLKSTLFIRGLEVIKRGQARFYKRFMGNILYDMIRIEQRDNAEDIVLRTLLAFKEEVINVSKNGSYEDLAQFAKLQQYKPGKTGTMANYVARKISEGAEVPEEYTRVPFIQTLKSKKHNDRGGCSGDVALKGSDTQEMLSEFGKNPDLTLNPYYYLKGLSKSLMYFLIDDIIKLDTRFSDKEFFKVEHIKYGLAPPPPNTDPKVYSDSFAAEFKRISDKYTNNFIKKHLDGERDRSTVFKKLWPLIYLYEVDQYDGDFLQHEGRRISKVNMRNLLELGAGSSRVASKIVKAVVERFYTLTSIDLETSDDYTQVLNEVKSVCMDIYAKGKRKILAIHGIVHKYFPSYDILQKKIKAGGSGGRLKLTRMMKEVFELLRPLEYGYLGKPVKSYYQDIIEVLNE